MFSPRSWGRISPVALLRRQVRQLAYMATFSFILSVCAAATLLTYIRPLASVVERRIRENCPEFNINDMGWQAVITCASVITRDIFRSARVGRTVPRLTLYTLTGTQVTLQDFMKPGRPLLVNFGSCT